MTDLATLLALNEQLTAARKMTHERWARIICALLAPAGSKVAQSQFNGAWYIYEPAPLRRDPFRLWSNQERTLDHFADAGAWLDAVAALQEWLLPGWVVARVSDSGEAGRYRWYAEIWHPQDATQPPAIGESGPTECLARLRAIVSALIAQAEGQDGAA